MSAIDRNDVASTIKEGFATDFLDQTSEGSVILSAFPTRPMTEGTERLPVANGGAEAHFVKQWRKDDGDNADAIKPTSIIDWTDQELVAEEIAHIIAVHDNDIQDASIDLLSDITRQGAEAVSRKLDNVILNGGAPATWAKSFDEAAAVSGQEILVGTDAVDTLDALVQAEGLLSDSGFNDPVFITRKSLANRIRYARDSKGNLLGAGDVLGDFNPVFASNNLLDNGVEGYLVDRTSVLVGVRSDLQVKLLTEATLTGVGNLAELDMTGVRFAFRAGYALKDSKAVVAVRRTASAGS